MQAISGLSGLSGEIKIGGVSDLGQDMIPSLLLETGLYILLEDGITQLQLEG